MELLLKHTPQPYPWGCQYYALYALVGDARLLADVTECNSARFEERARALGYYFSAVYADSTCTVPMPAELWATLFGSAEGVSRLQGFEVPFVVGVNSLKHRGVFHTVSLTLRGVSATDVAVRVFDPGAAGEKEYATLADFLASPYGRVYDLKQVLPLALFEELVPRAYGPDGPHVHPTVRQLWENAQHQTIAA